MKEDRALINDNAYDLIKLHGADILASQTYRDLSKNIQHHNSNTFAHQVQVAVLAIMYARRYQIKVDVRSLIRAALLHDYYLYCWHDKAHRPKGHAHHHGETAVENAKRDFGIDDFTAEIMIRHMWPINVFKFPRIKEAWILVWADKKATFRELCGKAAKVDRFERKK